MAYTHDGKKLVITRNAPIDPDGTDWQFFCYDNWLRAGESIIEHSALITNGIIVTNSTYIGTMVDDAGVSHDQTYGVQYKADTGATTITLTHRVSTSTIGAIDLGRTNIDHSVIIPVQTL